MKQRKTTALRTQVQHNRERLSRHMGEIADEDRSRIEQKVDDIEAIFIGQKRGRRRFLKLTPGHRSPTMNLRPISSWNRRECAVLPALFVS
jgi:hypothetical protein